MIVKRYAKNFTGQTIRLDGNHFEDCNMVDCKLVYSGKGGVSLISCDLDSVTFRFEGAAGNTVSMIRTFLAEDGLRSCMEEALGIEVAKPPKRNWLQRLLRL